MIDRVGRYYGFKEFATGSRDESNRPKNFPKSAKSFNTILFMPNIMIVFALVVMLAGETDKKSLATGLSYTAVSRVAKNSPIE